MRPIRWLHISDLHRGANDTWAQDVVLEAFLARVAKRCTDGFEADFVLVAGDIAFSGGSSEYAQAVGFFKALSKSAGGCRVRS